MSFMFCAPKKENEVEKEDKIFFLGGVVMEMKQKRKSCKCWREIKRGVFLSQPGHFLCFLTGRLFLL